MKYSVNFIDGKSNRFSSLGATEEEGVKDERNGKEDQGEEAEEEEDAWWSWQGRR